MSKNKAIEYIKRAKEQLSDDLLTVRFCQMARNNLDKALKELEDNMEQSKEQPSFKPFDKVLVRNSGFHKWRPAIFVQTRIGEYQRYYQRNKEKLLEKSKSWRQNHPEKVKEYQRRYYQKKRAAEKKEKKIMLNPDIDKAKSLFRDPSKTVHLQWLLEHNRNKSKQYESR